MPAQVFEVRRYNTRYHGAPRIVCDACFEPLPNDHYFHLFSEGRRVGIYPIHSFQCAERYIRRRLGVSDYLLVDAIQNDTDDTQEEATED